MIEYGYVEFIKEKWGEPGINERCVISWYMTSKTEKHVVEITIFHDKANPTSVNYSESEEYTYEKWGLAQNRFNQAIGSLFNHWLDCKITRTVLDEKITYGVVGKSRKES